jgi:inner membrane protein
VSAAVLVLVIACALFAPLLAWAVSRFHGEAALFKRWWLALWLALFTHPLLDAMTVYGTQLLQPFTDRPFGVDSMFIIDPAYTLPLIVGVVAALAFKRTERGLRWNLAALVLSTAYLGWSVAAQQVAAGVARASLQEQNIGAERLLVTPAPFNTVLWRLVAVTPTHYHEGYYSLLDEKPTVRWTAHERGADLMAQHASAEPVARMAAFTEGFYRLSTSPEGQLMLTDLRMGQEPSYVFNFNLGLPEAVGQAPATQVSARADIGQALPWLWRRVRGEDLLPMGAAQAAPR